MPESYCDYLIVGAGLAGASAADGIREIDKTRTITLLGEEAHRPYDRPPLSKKLWFGKKKVEDIFLHDPSYYERNGITFIPNRRVVAVDVKRKTVLDNQGESRIFGALLLATGGVPRPLQLAGGEPDDLCYYRYLDDFQRLRREAEPGKSAVIVGGGFIGSEMAAALCLNHLNVTLIYPASHLCDRVFPESLGLAMESLFRERGVRILKGDRPAAVTKTGSRYALRTTTGEKLEADLVIVGVGIRPAVELAARAGLSVADGIVVNAYLQTSHPDIYAAGDVAQFPYRGMGPSVRLEHWDHALNQGRHAGRNMAGARQAYAYMPYFFSDLFEFGYEAVGEINPHLDVVTDWQKENEKGVIYYLSEGIVRGAMMCNVWDKVPEARELILKRIGPPSLALHGAIA
jgi:3-phenylpropionate/trans-cinnamate dioxygenase ferredoxin reductase component